jgi:hypothetical protein
LATQTEPLEIVRPVGWSPTLMVSTTRRERGFTRETVSSPELVTQIDPLPEPTPLGSSPTLIGLPDTRFVAGSIRTSVSSSRFTTQTASPLDLSQEGLSPTAMRDVTRAAFGL